MNLPVFTKLLLFLAVAAAGPMWSAQGVTGKLKTGLYVDRGSRGSGVLYWARLLANSPQVELVLLEGADLRRGALDKLDLLVMPGGGSGAQMASMGEAGMTAVRRFVADGGAYVGTCAGLHCALNKPDRLCMLAYTRIPGGGGAEAPLSVEFSPEGAKRFGIEPGRYMVRYSHGPIVKPAPQPGEGRSEVVCTYSSSITPLGRDGTSFFNQPAALYGEYGKGKLAVTSFHPESYASSRCIALGMIYAATGVRVRLEFPRPSFRALRVGYFSRAIVGKRGVEETLAIGRYPEFDLRFTDCFDIDTGALEHLDVMIFSGGNEKRYRTDLLPRRRAAILNFLNRGGRVIVSGNAAKYLPEHPNRLVATEAQPLPDLLMKIYSAN